MDKEEAGKVHLWVEMGRRTQQMSLVCNLGKRIGLRRVRSDMCWDVGRGAVPALLMSSLFSDVTLPSARNKSAKGSRWLLSEQNGSRMS